MRSNYKKPEIQYVNLDANNNVIVCSAVNDIEWQLEDFGFNQGGSEL